MKSGVSSDPTDHSDGYQLTAYAVAASSAPTSRSRRDVLIPERSSRTHHQRTAMVRSCRPTPMSFDQSRGSPPARITAARSSVQSRLL